MIFVECFRDTDLVKTLGLPRKKIRHAGNKGAVCNGLAGAEQSGGLVDEDPGDGQPEYLQKMKVIKEENDTRLLCDKKGNRILVLRPRLEDWLLKAAANAGIDVKKYGFPDNARELHKKMNTRKFKNEKFINLIKDIRGKSPMMKSVEEFVESYAALP